MELEPTSVEEAIERGNQVHAGGQLLELPGPGQHRRRGTSRWPSTVEAADVGVVPAADDAVVRPPRSGGPAAPAEAPAPEAPAPAAPAPEAPAPRPRHPAAPAPEAPSGKDTAGEDSTT